MERLWSDGQLAVLKKALTAAVELGAGLLEATEVVEPNPIRPNESTSYSNLYHCDRDGVYLYIDMALKQISQTMERSKDPVSYTHLHTTLMVTPNQTPTHNHCFTV